MTDQLKLTGKFLGAGKTQHFGANNFPVRKLWLDTTDNPDYPNTPEFQVAGKAVEKLEGVLSSLQQDDVITVYFNVNGKKVTKDGRSFVITNLSIWRIDVETAAEPFQPAPVVNSPEQEEPDDLPF